MKRWTLVLWATLLGLSAWFDGARASAQDAPGTVTVKISGFKGTEGLALVTLYDNEQSWLHGLRQEALVGERWAKEAKAAQVVRAKITGGGMSVAFKDVKPGTYAVSVIHDENKNNELDMRWLPYPKPKEGMGASNDAEAKAGPPKWEAAKFSVGAAGVTVKVTLKYPE